MRHAVRVLVVDDSAFARKVIREVLAGSPEIEVIDSARDGIDALEKIAALRPDVVTLDLMMPNLDGVGVLRALAAFGKSAPVIVVSMTDQDTELGVAALSLGAFDIVKKPTGLATDQLYELGDELRAKVLAAGRSASSSSRPASPLATPLPVAQAAYSTPLLLAIGASTGGPQALTLLVKALPADLRVPVAIVLHLPIGYTEAFAHRLDLESPLEVVEARDGLLMRSGLVVVGRAGMHLTFEGTPLELRTRLQSAPLGTPHRPSVDVMFRSAADTLGAAVLGVVLTGMGDDGLAGARAITSAGGRVITEAESSCVVYGMPRSVVEAGVSAGQAPIGAMAALITQHL